MARVSDAFALFTQSHESFRDQLRVKFSHLVQFLDDRDALFSGDFELIEGVDQVLELGAAGSGRVERDEIFVGDERISLGWDGSGTDRRNRQALMADDDGA